MSHGFTVVLAGRPGSGKGTQGERIASTLGYAHLSTGDLVRRAMDVDDPLGMLTSTVGMGGFVDDDTVFELLRAQLGRCAGMGVMIDGFPRTKAQAQLLLDERPVDLVLQLEVSARRVTERLLQRHRSDDGMAAVQHRLHQYEELTRPMLRWLARSVPRVVIDGDRPPEVVHEALRQAFVEHTRARRRRIEITA